MTGCGAGCGLSASYQRSVLMVSPARTATVAPESAAPVAIFSRGNSPQGVSQPSMGEIDVTSISAADGAQHAMGRGVDEAAAPDAEGGDAEGATWTCLWCEHCNKSNKSFCEVCGGVKPPDEGVSTTVSASVLATVSATVSLVASPHRHTGTD